MNTHLITPDTPQALVSRWIRLERDGGPAHLGLLTRAEELDGYPGLWSWALSTPLGPMAGGGHLPAQVLTRAHPEDVDRARSQLARCLHRDQALLAELRDCQEPTDAVARIVAHLKHLQATLTDQLT